MNPFQQLLNTVGRGYREADKRLGGYLPGGGTPNPLSNTIRVINPQDVAGYVVNESLAPATQAIRSNLRKVLDSSSWGTNIKALPKLMDAANVQMQRLGQPGSWSVDFPKTLPKDFGQGTLPKGVQLDTQGGGSYVSMGPYFDLHDQAIRTNSKVPAWIAAHEFGHAIDFFKRPKAFEYAKDIFNDPAKLARAETNFSVKNTSPGALVITSGNFKNNDDRSLLGAGIEGALAGLGASQHTLIAEAQADRYGMPLAKAAGIPWNHKQNLLAKGSYLTTGMFPGFTQGVIGELLGRGANAITGLTGSAMRAAQGNKLNPMEQALSQYGYNPAEYGLTSKGNEIQINKRNQMEKELYNFITDPNRVIVPKY